MNTFCPLLYLHPVLYIYFWFRPRQKNVCCAYESIVTILIPSPRQIALEKHQYQRLSPREKKFDGPWMFVGGISERTQKSPALIPSWRVSKRSWHSCRRRSRSCRLVYIYHHFPVIFSQHSSSVDHHSFHLFVYFPCSDLAVTQDADGQGMDNNEQVSILRNASKIIYRQSQ